MLDSHDDILRLCRLLSAERDHGKQESLLAELRIAILAEQAAIKAELATRRRKQNSIN